jgi:hypothetical protein
MNSVTITVDAIVSIEAVQALRNALADRRGLHAAMATDASEFTKTYLRENGRHATADRLGAKPTGFRARAAKQVSSVSSADAAMVRIPRSTGLGRAFHDMVILPGSGRKWLTLPADARTYGKRVGDFPEKTFEWKIVQGRFPALVFAGTLEVGYYLARKVKQKQDRTLLPSDEGYQELGSRSAVTYLNHLIDGEVAR